MSSGQVFTDSWGAACQTDLRMFPIFFKMKLSAAISVAFFEFREIAWVETNTKP